MRIGDVMGEAKKVDLDGGRVQVMMNGFKPLEFETTVGFDDGDEESTILLRYERLYGFCKECHNLCHDYDHCSILRAQREEKERLERLEKEKMRRREQKQEFGMSSYKGVVINEVKEGDDGRRHNGKAVDYKGKGKGVMVDSREDRGSKATNLHGKLKADGEGTSTRAPPVEQGKRQGEITRRISRGGEGDIRELRTREIGICGGRISVCEHSGRAHWRTDHGGYGDEVLQGEESLEGGGVALEEDTRVSYELDEDLLGEDLASEEEIEDLLAEEGMDMPDEENGDIEMQDETQTQAVGILITSGNRVRPHQLRSKVQRKRWEDRPPVQEMVLCDD
ncbi:unnamed protein product [Microthlaspi erraticum]|uniref:Zinc knuckle CX2CX4HX4C domain-containing protein n=1 Tax=Microthlaspi erraticum TaxID=1685480 RepID=A0A6D2I0M1_9BRAS|nr:unnamed protein product [Microthlaspi erraticum]